MHFPLFLAKVHAGFPSPAEDFVESSIDLNKELIRNCASTFFVRVQGDSMRDAGIDCGDLLIIDKSLDYISGKIVVCSLNGEFTLKTLKMEKNFAYLIPANKNYPVIKIDENSGAEIWGVVTYVIKKR